MPRNLGVYLCSGCSIGDAVSLPGLEKVAKSEYKAAVCRTHSFLCGADGAAAIRADVEAGTVDTTVIGACSARVKADVFAFPPALVERVNLREHVAWCQKPGDEDTQDLAEDYLRMGIVRAQRTEPEPARRDDQPSAFWWWAAA